MFVGIVEKLGGCGNALMPSSLGNSATGRGCIKHKTLRFSLHCSMFSAVNFNAECTVLKTQSE